MVEYNYICTLSYNPLSERLEEGLPVHVTWNLVPLTGEQIVKDNMVREGVRRMTQYETANDFLPDVVCRARYTSPGPGVEIKVRIKRDRIR